MMRPPTIRPPAWAKGTDGIHMREEKGEQFFTDMPIAVAKLAVLSSSGLEGASQATFRLDGKRTPSFRRAGKSAAKTVG